MASFKGIPGFVPTFSTEHQQVVHVECLLLLLDVLGELHPSAPTGVPIAEPQEVLLLRPQRGIDHAARLVLVDVPQPDTDVSKMINMYYYVC